MSDPSATYLPFRAVTLISWNGDRAATSVQRRFRSSYGSYAAKRNVNLWKLRALRDLKDCPRNRSVFDIESPFLADAL
jgi:hypothetical protein